MAKKPRPAIPPKQIVKDVKTPSPADIQEKYYGKPELDPRKL